MMKYCSKCGNRLTEEDVFCSKCGAKTSVFGVYEEPEILTSKKVVRKGTAGTAGTAGLKKGASKKIDDSTQPGARYTAAVEKNAVAVTEYLKRASNMEWEKYQLGEISRKLASREENLRKEIALKEEAITSYNEKAEQLEKKIKDYKKLEYRRKVFKYKFTFDPVVVAILLAVMLAIFILGGMVKVPPFTWIFGLICPSGSIGVLSEILWIIGVPLVVELILQAVRYFRRKAEHEKNEDEAGIKYEQEQEELEKTTLETLNRDLKDYRNIISNLENEKARLENISMKGLTEAKADNKACLERLEAALEYYYSTQVLDPKYRSLVPVTTMCGYFEAGKCMDLTGTDGAYNLFEKELKQEAITDNLAGITGGMDKIGESQRGIISQVAKINGKAEALVDTVDRATARNLAANPVGTDLKKRLEKSADMKACYDDMDSTIADDMEYIRSVYYHSRQWF